jgi:hypothetical protein
VVSQVEPVAAVRHVLVPQSTAESGLASDQFALDRRADKLMLGPVIANVPPGTTRMTQSVGDRESKCLLMI